MVTIENKIKEILVSHGLLEKQAAAIVEMVKADEANEAMERQWKDDAEGYPSVLLSALWHSVERCALQYIDANCPEAWFRSLFVREGNE